MLHEHFIDDQILIVTPGKKSLQFIESQNFRKKVVDLLTYHNLDHLIIDMQHVSTVDHEGIGSLLSLLKYVHAKNGQLKLIGLTQLLNRVFKLVAMHKIFDICDSMEEAKGECRI